MTNVCWNSFLVMYLETNECIDLLSFCFEILLSISPEHRYITLSVRRAGIVLYLMRMPGLQGIMLKGWHECQSTAAGPMDIWVEGVSWSSESTLNPCHAFSQSFLDSAWQLQAHIERLDLEHWVFQFSQEMWNRSYLLSWNLTWSLKRCNAKVICQDMLFWEGFKTKGRISGTKSIAKGIAQPTLSLKQYWEMKWIYNTLTGGKTETFLWWILPF